MTHRFLPLLAAALVLAAGCAQNKFGPTSPTKTGEVVLDPKIEAALNERAEAVLAEAIQSGQPPLQSLAFETFLATGQALPEYDFRSLNDPRARLVALVAAVKQKAPGSGELASLCLRDADASVRLAAAWGRLQAGEGAQAMALRDALASREVAIRRNAAWLFGLMDNRSAVDMLKTKLDDPDAVVVLRTAEALGRLGSSDGLDAVRSLTEYERHEVRCWATRLLGRYGTKADIPRLQRLFESRYLDVKFAAIGSLARQGDFTRIDFLVNMLDVTGKGLRQAATRDPQLAEAVAGMKDAELEAFAGDMRRLASLELGEAAYAPALESLSRAMEKPDLLERTIAASAVCRIVWESRPWVKRALTDQPGTVPPRKPGPVESLLGQPRR